MCRLAQRYNCERSERRSSSALRLGAFRRGRVPGQRLREHPPLESAGFVGGRKSASHHQSPDTRQSSCCDQGRQQTQCSSDYTFALPCAFSPVAKGQGRFCACARMLSSPRQNVDVREGPSQEKRACVEQDPPELLAKVCPPSQGLPGRVPTLNFEGRESGLPRSMPLSLFGLFSAPQGLHVLIAR